MKNTVLVIAAHPDDELLGAGGTLVKHVAAGDTVHARILGEGVTSRDTHDTANISVLHSQTEKAGAIIGFSSVLFAHLPDNAFDTVSLLSIVKEVEKYIADIKPDVVYTHHQFDLNIDHRLTSEAVMTACRPCNEHAPSKIYAFETLSSTEWQVKDERIFKPNMYVDISDTIDKKITALREYTLEMREYPHSRSFDGVRILSQYRGMEAGLHHAEAFCLLREIKNI